MPTILVCEPYEGLQEAFRLMLDDWASVQVVSKTTEWLPVLAKQHWDLFVLDLDGQAGEPLELVRNIRLAYPDLKMLLVAGEFDYDFQVACVKLGQLSFITKPFSAAATVAKMKTLLGLAAPSIHTRVVKIALS
jgi:DNA-binding NtrC family response regulator